MVGLWGIGSEAGGAVAHGGGGFLIWWVVVVVFVEKSRNGEVGISRHWKV